MPRKKKTKLPERVKPSDTEANLRRYLANKHKIKDEDDDRGFHDWIAKMNSPTNDARSEWEKSVQARLARELGLVA